MLSMWIFFLISLLSKATGDHFNGGTITWRLLNATATGSPVAVVITQSYQWAYTYFKCNSSMIANHELLTSAVYPGLNTSTLDCIANCGSGSVGYVSPSIISYCTDYSIPYGISFGQRSDTVFLQAGDDFSVAYQGNAWRLLASISAIYWSISARISIQLRSDNGLYNNAPVSTMMSPITIFVNKTTAIHVPVSDADGDVIRCRWPTNSGGVDECGDICPPLPFPTGTEIYPNCTIIITGRIANAWYAIPIMIEDFFNASSLIPLSAVPVQFLVYVSALPSCKLLPEIIGELPVDSCTILQVGKTISFRLIAQNNCNPTVTITDIVTLSFANVMKSDLIQINSTLYYKTITWTATSAQLGYQVMCAIASNSEKSQSNQYCFKFYVTTENVTSCPSSISTTTITTTTTTTTQSLSTSASTSSTLSATTTITTTSVTSIASANAKSTIPPNVEFINWLLISTITGIPLLLALLTACCLYCYYCCGHDANRIQSSDRTDNRTKAPRQQRPRRVTIFTLPTDL